MKEEKINNDQNQNSGEPGNNEHQLNEDILNEIERESRAEASADEVEDVNGSEEGLLGKIGFGKKDKHKKEIKELQDKVNELNDKYLRLHAEFDNARKRNARERMELMKTAGQEVIISMLGTLDDFNRAIKQMDSVTDLQALKDGIHLIYNKMKGVLDVQGLTEMKSVGTDFDPELHDAITEVPAPTEDMKGKVIDEVQKGYFLNGKIIRHAKVIVGR